MNQQKCTIVINAMEYGRYELRLVPTGEYWQVYKMKGKTGSWLDNCYTLADAFTSIYEELEGKLPSEFIDCNCA